MDIRKSRPRRLAKVPLKDITNNSKKKSKSQKSSKNSSKCGFYSKDLPENHAQVIQKSREFYLSLKESQLLSLFSEVKLNSENIKCRYKILRKKLKKSEEKKNFLSKLIQITPLPERQSLSPISFYDSHWSGLSLGLETNHSRNLADLDQKLKVIENEIGKVIEQECFVNKQKRLVSKERSNMIVLIGSLYEKKQVLLKESHSINLVKASNRNLKSNLSLLKEQFSSFLIKTQSAFSSDSKSPLQSSVAHRKLVVEDLKSQLQKINSQISEKETYLTEILTIKSELLKRSEKMKEFDKYFSYTKSAVMRKTLTPDLV